MEQGEQNSTTYLKNIEKESKFLIFICLNLLFAVKFKTYCKHLILIKTKIKALTMHEKARFIKQNQNRKPNCKKNKKPRTCWFCIN